MPPDEAMIWSEKSLFDGGSCCPTQQLTKKGPKNNDDIGVAEVDRGDV
jgi:hypothetical protein